MNPTYHPLLILPFFFFSIISNDPSVPIFALARELAEDTQMSPSPGPSVVDEGGSPSTSLHAGNENYAIHTGKPNWPFSAYAANLTPIHGVYFFIVSTLMIIGVCICFKMGKSMEQVNGVRYQELEMAQSESASVNEIDTEEGWDQGWDDEWQELKNDKASITHQGNMSPTELASRNTSSHGSGKDWRD